MLTNYPAINCLSIVEQESIQNVESTMYLYTFLSVTIDRNKNYAERSNIIGIIIVSFLYHKKPLWRLLPLVYLGNIIFSYHSIMLFTAKNVLKSAEDFVTTLRT